MNHNGFEDLEMIFLDSYQLKIKELIDAKRMDSELETERNIFSS